MDKQNTVSNFRNYKYFYTGEFSPKKEHIKVIEEIFGFITSGSIGGIPTLLIMALPLIAGLIIGFFVKKILKFAVIAAILAVVASYLGLFTISLDSLGSIAEEYGPAAFHYGALLIGILPLSLGFIIGLMLGFLFG
jgi:uncharacterized membrane protein (Fun14 family)